MGARSMSFVGMDVAQMTAVGRSLAQSGEQVTRITLAMDQLVDRSLQQWQGGDAVAFSATWRAHLRPRFVSASQSLEDMARTVAQNIAQQEAASRGAAAGGGAQGMTPAQLDALRTILEDTGHGLNILGGIEEVAKILDELSKKLERFPNGRDLLAFLSKEADLSWGTALKSLKSVGGVFTGLGIALALSEFKVALDTSDEPAAWDAVFDLTFGTAASFVPFGGIAWAGATYVTEVVGTAAYEHFDVATHTQNFVLSQMFGPGVRGDNMTPEQAAAFTARYEGLTGIAYSVVDHLGAAIYTAGEGVAEVVWQGMQGAQVGAEVLQEGAGALREGAEALEAELEENLHDLGRRAADVFAGVKAPWQR